MNDPIQKAPLTVVDYKAAEARLAEVRAAAVEGFEAAQARGDEAAAEHFKDTLKEGLADFKCFREGLPRDVLLSIHADRILESFFVDKENFVNLTIPADVSDKEAMHALNARFRELSPGESQTAINETEIDDILDAGGGSAPRARGPRVITLIGVVPGSECMERAEQRAVLEQKGLTFPHPIEQALAAAAYACRCGGENLFDGRPVRGSVAGIALERSVIGVYVEHYDGKSGGGYFRVAASGTPLR